MCRISDPAPDGWSVPPGLPIADTPDTPRSESVSLRRGSGDAVLPTISSALEVPIPLDCQGWAGVP